MPCPTSPTATLSLAACLALTALPTAVGFASSPALAVEPPVTLASLTPKPGETDESVQEMRASIARLALSRADAGDYATARMFARMAAIRHLNDLITWRRLGDSRETVDYPALAAFVERHRDWPGMARLRARMETMLPEEWGARATIDWFADRRPVTPEGATRLISALVENGDADRARKVARQAWGRLNFSHAQQKMFLTVAAPYLRAADHRRRLDRLLWRHQADDAERMLALVDRDHALLAKARIRLMRNMPGVDAAIKRVPARLQNDPGLLYERIHWRRGHGFDEGARDLLAKAPVEPPHRLRWWRERHIQVRALLEDGNADAAYRLARDHRQKDGLGFAEAEWIAGWIALDHLREPARAYDHFTAMYEAVSTPISRARGAFWAGRAAAALGRDAAAKDWYAKAAAHDTVFYGQLAAQRLHGDASVSLPFDSPRDEAAKRRVNAHPLTDIVALLTDLGAGGWVDPFARRLAADFDDPAGKRALIAKLRALGRADLGLRLAKRAMRDGIALPEATYPVEAAARTGSHAPADEVEDALVHAVIRQESEFRVDARSHVGAQGLMQLMPATARTLARKLDIGYQPERLASDPAYNVTLGRAYLRDLLERFGGSYILALAAYNAGPARVREWIDRFGDPRMPGVDAVAWVEMIPYGETRNYVQRVMENVQVYRYRLAHPAEQPVLTLTRDLERGGDRLVLDRDRPFKR